MKLNGMLLAAIGVAAAVGSTAFIPAFAQRSETIRVDIDDIANKIAVNIQADPSQIPRTVQAPVDVAVKVCGIPPDVLIKLVDVHEGCTATTTSRALEEIVQTQVPARKR